MKTQRELTGQGKRLAEMLGMVFASQRIAAEFLGISQPQLNGFYGKEELPRSFWNKYAHKLADAGLNVGYISDPQNNAPMFEEAAMAAIARLEEKLRIRKTA